MLEGGGRPLGLKIRRSTIDSLHCNAPRAFADRGALINRGGEAAIYRGELRTFGSTSSAQAIAIKVFDTADAASREAGLLLKLSPHPHILPLAGNHDGSETDSCALNLMLAEGGDLHSYVEAVGALPEGLAARFAAQIASALAHCHENKIAHGDVKPENVLLSSARSPPLHGAPLMRDIYLCDFGAASQKRAHPLSAVRGSFWWAAPEIAPRLCDLVQTAGRQSASSSSSSSSTTTFNPFQADVWSLGCLIYFMLMGRRPFGDGAVRGDDTFDALLRNRGSFHRLYSASEKSALAAHVSIAAGLSRAAREILTMLLRVEPDARPTMASLASIPWFSKPPPLPLFWAKVADKDLGGGGGRGRGCSLCPRRFDGQRRTQRRADSSAHSCGRATHGRCLSQRSRWRREHAGQLEVKHEQPCLSDNARAFTLAAPAHPFALAHYFRKQEYSRYALRSA